MKTYLKDVVKVGDYVNYVPNKEVYTVFEIESGFTKPQLYKPAETRVPWRVMQVDEKGVSLIAGASIGKLILGGSKGYKSVKQTLNCLCDAYVNPLWAVSGRCLGCTDINVTPVINHPISYDCINANMMKWLHELRDDDYREECHWITAHDLLPHECVWLAARGFGFAGEIIFSVVSIGTLGNENHEELHIAGREGTTDQIKANGVLPVLQLRKDVEFVRGDGTRNRPYVLKKD